VVAASIAAGVVGCLPDDTRDPPAQILVTAVPSEATRSGFEADDGWTIRFDTVALTLGRFHAIPVDGPCTSYSATLYAWLIDYSVADREKLALVHALGDCSLGFSTWAPDDVTELGAGASVDMASFMADANLWVEGMARGPGGEKTFSWRLRLGVDLAGCLVSPVEPVPLLLALESGASHELELTIRAEGLFESLYEPGVFSSDLVVLADENGDGHTSEEEVRPFLTTSQTNLPQGVNVHHMSPIVTASAGWWCVPQPAGE
jgi:hypothetical protein